ncbi:MAG: hypothetical protein ACLU30_09435 [Odoribacter splanchnicus]
MKIYVVCLLTRRAENQLRDCFGKPKEKVVLEQMKGRIIGIGGMLKVAITYLNGKPVV